jgi:hypothetical protein
MRTPSLLRITAAFALAGCDSGFSPSAAPAGSWIEGSPIPGSFTTMELATRDTVVTGAGVRHIEAGRPDSFAVAGVQKGVSITLHFALASGATAGFSGFLRTARNLDGTTHQPGLPPFTEKFSKR